MFVCLQLLQSIFLEEWNALIRLQGEVEFDIDGVKLKTDSTISSDARLSVGGK